MGIRWSRISRFKDREDLYVKIAKKKLHLLIKGYGIFSRSHPGMQFVKRNVCQSRVSQIELMRCPLSTRCISRTNFSRFSQFLLYSLTFNAKNMSKKKNVPMNVIIFRNKLELFYPYIAPSFSHSTFYKGTTIHSYF